MATAQARKQHEGGGFRNPSLALRARFVARRSRRPGATGFTLIELLVVIVIIGVLAALVLTVAAHVSGHQKGSTTRNTMRLVGLAIDQFAETDPLQGVYDNARLRMKNGANEVVVAQTFGPYPPYQLAGNTSGYPPTTVRDALEPNSSNAPAPVSLTDRLWRDMGKRATAKDKWAYDYTVLDPRNDDIRALYCYLAVYCPGVLSQVPDSAKHALANACPDPINYPEMINPTGQGTYKGNPGAIDVLAIYDAWGVPLDYFLQVKLERMVRSDDTSSNPQPMWVVTDRVPVLRSRGITDEQRVQEERSNSPDNPQKWIFSEAFPQPPVNGVDPITGALPSGAPTSSNGWVRVLAGGKAGDKSTWDNYKYLPEQ